jgi:hypothetical protein
MILLVNDVQTGIQIGFACKDLCLCCLRINFQQQFDATHQRVLAIKLSKNAAKWLLSVMMMCMSPLQRHINGVDIDIDWEQLPLGAIDRRRPRHGEVQSA